VVSCEVGKQSLGLALGPHRVGDHIRQYLTDKGKLCTRSGAEHQGKVGGSKSSLELCEKSTEVRRAEKGPEAPFMLFLAGAQTSSYLQANSSVTKQLHTGTKSPPLHSYNRYYAKSYLYQSKFVVSCHPRGLESFHWLFTSLHVNPSLLNLDSCSVKGAVLGNLS
jgi:hypothetical protein